MTDLQELKKLLGKATAGPWHFNEDARSINSDQWLAEGASEYRPCIVTLPVWHAAHSYEQKHNAALIVAAVNSLPALIERVEELERALQELYDCGCVAIDALDDAPADVFDESEAQKLEDALHEARAALQGAKP